MNERERERARLLRAARDVLDDGKVNFVPFLTRDGATAWAGGRYEWDADEVSKSGGTVELRHDITLHLLRHYGHYFGGSAVAT